MCNICTPAEPQKKKTTQNGRLTLIVVDCDPQLEVDVTVMPIDSFQFGGTRKSGIECRNHSVDIPLPRRQN